MSDRPTGANGKRSQTWGTTDICPARGRCLCFACHPKGPCVGEDAEIAPISRHTRGIVAAGASIVTQAFQS